MLVIRYNENKGGAIRWEGLIHGLFYSFCYVFVRDYAFLTSVILNAFCFKCKLYQLLFLNNHCNNQGRRTPELFQKLGN